MSVIFFIATLREQSKIPLAEKQERWENRLFIMFDEEWLY